MSLPEDDEGLAAEYVLGTLDAAERAAVAARRLREPELDAAISAWEARLAPLSEAAPPARRRRICSRASRRVSARPTPSSISQACSAPGSRAGERQPPARAAGRGPRRRARLRRHHAADVPHQFVAVLQKGPDEPAFAMTVDIDRQEFSVRPVAAKPPEGNSYELWIIAPKLGAPKSLGVIDANAVSRERRLSAFDPAS